MSGNFSSNMSNTAIQEQYNNLSKPVSQAKTAYDEKNYLNVGLGPTENKRIVKIRLLPITPEATTPFQQIYVHSLKVDKRVQASGFKSVICPVRNGYEHDVEKCPFCMTVQKAREAYKATDNELEKKTYSEMGKEYYAKPQWVVRCIERGHEEDGPKFWKFSHQGLKKDGVYDKMNDLNDIFEAEYGGTIYDLNEGKDFIITISKTEDGKIKYGVTASDKRTPLTDNVELGMQWINDTKKWDDIFKTKPYGYLEILLNKGVPMWDKENKCYYDGNQETAKEESPIEVPGTNGGVSEKDDLPF